MTKTPARQHPSYSPKSSTFLNEVRRAMRLKHMSHRMEPSYLYYILWFIRFPGKRHPPSTEFSEARLVRRSLYATVRSSCGGPR